MSMDDDGARRLISSILKQAMNDYGKGCDTRVFIHSDWCAALCEGININHKKYVAACNKSAQKSNFKS